MPPIAQRSLGLSLPGLRGKQLPSENFSTLDDGSYLSGMSDNIVQFKAPRKEIVGIKEEDEESIQIFSNSSPKRAPMKEPSFSISQRIAAFGGKFTRNNDSNEKKKTSRLEKEELQESFSTRDNASARKALAVPSNPQLDFGDLPERAPPRCGKRSDTAHNIMHGSDDEAVTKSRSPRRGRRKSITSSPTRRSPPENGSDSQCAGVRSSVLKALAAPSMSDLDIGDLLQHQPVEGLNQPKKAVDPGNPVKGEEEAGSSQSTGEPTSQEDTLHESFRSLESKSRSRRRRERSTDTSQDKPRVTSSNDKSRSRSKSGRKSRSQSADDVLLDHRHRTDNSEINEAVRTLKRTKSVDSVKEAEVDRAIDILSRAFANDSEAEKMAMYLAKLKGRRNVNSASSDETPTITTRASNADAGRERLNAKYSICVNVDPNGETRSINFEAESSPTKPKPAVEAKLDLSRKTTDDSESTHRRTRSIGRLGTVERNKTPSSGSQDGSASVCVSSTERCKTPSSRRNDGNASVCVTPSERSERQKRMIKMADGFVTPTSETSQRKVIRVRVVPKGDKSKRAEDSKECDRSARRSRSTGRSLSRPKSRNRAQSASRRGSRTSIDKDLSDNPSSPCQARDSYQTPPTPQSPEITRRQNPSLSETLSGIHSGHKDDRSPSTVASGHTVERVLKLLDEVSPKKEASPKSNQNYSYHLSPKKIRKAIPSVDVSIVDDDASDDTQACLPTNDKNSGPSVPPHIRTENITRDTMTKDVEETPWKHGRDGSQRPSAPLRRPSAQVEQLETVKNGRICTMAQREDKTPHNLRKAKSLKIPKVSGPSPVSVTEMDKGQSPTSKHETKRRAKAKPSSPRQLTTHLEPDWERSEKQGDRPDDVIEIKPHKKPSRRHSAGASSVVAAQLMIPPMESTDRNISVQYEDVDAVTLSSNEQTMVRNHS